jgi:hypothetical protein
MIAGHIEYAIIHGQVHTTFIDGTSNGTEDGTSADGNSRSSLTAAAGNSRAQRSTPIRQLRAPPVVDVELVSRPDRQKRPFHVTLMAASCRQAPHHTPTTSPTMRIRR